jgi:tRNA A-37 threonylcarbamoyl transferase component Bud32
LVSVVAFGSSKTGTVEFLLLHIVDFVSLTKLYKSSVPEAKCEAWSQKTKQYDTLHKHNIISGDSKANNLIVDKTNELWIIEFSRSYTEDWVDIEISEIKDDQEDYEETLTKRRHEETQGQDA